MSIELKNARIKSTSLGYEDHGILTAFLHLDYGGICQGFGGYCLAGESTSVFIEGVLKAVKVSTWEDLPGKYIRVKAERSKVHEISHPLEDTWFNPRKTFEENEQKAKV